MAQLDDIKQKIQQGLSDRQIALAVGKRRTLISQIRRGEFEFSSTNSLPEWMDLLDWDVVLKEIALKHPIKFIWEEYALNITSYPNFTKYLYKKFPY